jgi:hypothetical protein
MPAAVFVVDAPRGRRAVRAAAMAAAAAAAVTATLSGDRASAATINGTVAPAEYATTLATQTTPTGFGDNVSELNQALTNYTPGGNLELALTGNLEEIGNGLIVFIDSKAGGGIGSSAANGFNQFASVSGERTQHWGTDTNPGTGVTPSPGGGSIVPAGFNPDYALEIHNTGGSAYFINVIDLALPNAPSANRDIPLSSAALNSGVATTHTYTRFDANNAPVDSGDVTSSFDNTNAAGVTDTSAANAATATKGIELLFEGQFLGKTPGHALRMLAFITSSDGQFLSNQFLPGLGAGAPNPGEANDPPGTPLFDARNFSDRLYLDVFTPTFTAASGDWATPASWTGGAAPSGSEHSARLGGTAAQSINIGATGITLGHLEFTNPAGTTLSGGGTVTLNAGNGAAATFVTAGNHTINATVNVQNDWRVNVAASSSVSTGGLSMAANKRLTKVGDGTLTVGGGTILNGAGLAVDVQRGTLAANGDLGSGLDARTTAPTLTAGLPGGGSPAVVNFAATQTLKSLTLHNDAVANVLPNRSRVVVADTVALNGNAKLDLGDNKLIAHAMPAGSATAGVYSGVQGMVQRAYNFGAWDQPGLTTSMPNAGQNAGVLSNTETIGVAIASQVLFIEPTQTALFQGQTVTGASTIAMYTYAGDLNFDGLVDGADYGVIDNFVQFPGTDGYVNGDFNYDGVIDGADYGVIDNTVQLQGAPFPGVTFGPGAASESSGGLSGVTAVPEPSACGFAILAATNLLRRRRRR